MCADGSVKVYDVATFDMIAMLRLPFVPGTLCFLAHKRALKRKLAVSEQETGMISMFEIGESEEAVRQLKDTHQAPVTAMAANSAHGTAWSSSRLLCCVQIARFCRLDGYTGFAVHM